MKRVEKWLITLMITHAFLLLIAQMLIDYSDIHYFVDPVYQYLGVYHTEDTTYLKTLDHILDNVLSF